MQFSRSLLAILAATFAVVSAVPAPAPVLDEVASPVEVREEPASPVENALFPRQSGCPRQGGSCGGGYACDCNGKDIVSLDDLSILSGCYHNMTSFSRHCLARHCRNIVTPSRVLK